MDIYVLSANKLLSFGCPKGANPANGWVTPQREIIGTPYIAARVTIATVHRNHYI